MLVFDKVLKGREKFVAFMQAKKDNHEWKSHLKEAIKHYEEADKTCKVTTGSKRTRNSSKRLYFLKSKIFKAWHSTLFTIR